MANPEVVGAEKGQPTAEEIISWITLEHVQITGDTAGASVKSAPLAESFVTNIPDAIEFRQIENRWYCHIDPR